METVFSRKAIGLVFEKYWDLQVVDNQLTLGPASCIIIISVNFCGIAYQYRIIFKPVVVPPQPNPGYQPEFVVGEVNVLFIKIYIYIN